MVLQGFMSCLFLIINPVEGLDEAFSPPIPLVEIKTRLSQGQWYSQCLSILVVRFCSSLLSFFEWSPLCFCRSWLMSPALRGADGPQKRHRKERRGGYFNFLRQCQQRARNEGGGGIQKHHVQASMSSGFYLFIWDSYL